MGECHTDMVDVASDIETPAPALARSSASPLSGLPARLFTELAPQHTPAMMRTAAALVGLDEAEDAAQDALIKAWLAWNTLRDISALRSWLLLGALLLQLYSRDNMPSHPSLVIRIPPRPL